MPDATDDHMKKRRRWHDLTRRLHDDLTKGKMDSRIQYENALSRGLPRIFWNAKDFCAIHEVAAGAWESPPATIRWLKMPSRMVRYFHDHSRIWKFLSSCFHLVSTSGQCDASITVARTKQQIVLSLTGKLNHLLISMWHSVMYVVSADTFLPWFVQTRHEVELV